MNDYVEASKYDIGTTSIKLIRAGNVVQIIFSSQLEARFLYKELSEKYKRAEDRLSGV
jgi:uroporphyrinogen-III synthase